MAILNSHAMTHGSILGFASLLCNQLIVFNFFTKVSKTAAWVLLPVVVVVRFSVIIHPHNLSSNILHIQSLEACILVNHVIPSYG